MPPGRQVPSPGASEPALLGTQLPPLSQPECSPVPTAVTWSSWPCPRPSFSVTSVLFLSLPLSHPPRDRVQGLEAPALATKVTITALLLSAAHTKLHPYCPWFLERTQPPQTQRAPPPLDPALRCPQPWMIPGPGRSAHPARVPQHAEGPSYPACSSSDLLPRPHDRGGNGQRGQAAGFESCHLELHAALFMNLVDSDVPLWPWVTRDEGQPCGGRPG